VSAPPAALVARSAIDEERFGVRVARAHDVRAADVETLLAFCRGEDVQLLIARCATTELAAAQALEAAGAFLADTLVYYARDLAATPLPEDADASRVRALRAGDAEAVRRIAAEAFQGYGGHYHADPHLDRRLCDEAYSSWAFRSCTSRDVADQVLVAELDGEVAGFITLRLNSADEGEGALFAVAPAARRTGLGRSLLVGSLEWFGEQGCRRMVISTQVTNVRVQRIWTRLGFEPSHSFYTFHQWLDR
jgi:ribosomal protein S18 acetylase RimI-like enzyme